MSAAEDKPSLELYGWLHPTNLAIAFAAMAAGFGQFGAVSALGDVAKAFGHMTHGTTIADQAGLSGTELGIGLAVLRLASIGGLPLTGLADRFGRRKMLLRTCAIGLCITIIAAASPGYWWFVAIFALGRPLLSTTTAICQVIAAERTNSANRARAIALVAAGYGFGSGLTAVIHSLASSALGFRGIFALAAVPLLALVPISRHISEPQRFLSLPKASERPPPILGAFHPLVRKRMLVVSAIAFTVAIMTGPANSFVFIYSQNVRHLSGTSTALMVVGAGGTGLVGLVLGQRLSDRIGRRPTGIVAVLSMGATGILAYSGSRPALVVGYLLGVMSASIFAPAAGSLANELFDTSTRASVAGWEVGASVLGAVGGLLLFGTLADIGNRFSIAAIVTSCFAIPACLFFLLLPETLGHEPEDLWPEARRSSAR